MAFVFTTNTGRMEEKKSSWVDEGLDQSVNAEVPQKPLTGFEKLTHWSLDTCTNGLPNIARATHTGWRIFWIILVIGATVATVEQIYEAIDKYIKHPINVNLKYMNQPQLEFPAITICNLNPIRLSAIKKYATEHPELATALGINVAKNLTGVHRGADSHQTRVAYLRLMADLNDTQKYILGHQPETFIIHCTYEGEECLKSDFHSFWSSHHGNCFTFNHGYDNRSGIHYNTKTGSAYGLKLELFLEQDEYIDSLSESAGAKVILHKANTMPFPDDQGNYAPPGYLTSIATKMLVLSRLKYPFEDLCVNYTRDEAISHSIYSYLYDVNYTRDACYKTCLQSSIIAECGCADSELPFSSVYFKDIHYDKGHSGQDLSACVSDAKITCMEEVLVKYKHGDITCDNCPLPCIDVLYPETTSLAQWPSLNHKQTLYDSLAAEGAHLNKIINGENGTAPTPNDNLLKVEIYFQQLSYEYIYQVEAFTWTDLLAALGGVVGLFLGLSVVAVFEFVELATIMIVHCFTSRNKGRISVSPAAEAT